MPRPLRSLLLLGLAYFACACAALALTRASGAPLFVWPASALLAVWLAGIPGRRWAAPVAAAAIAAFAAALLAAAPPALAAAQTLAQLAEAACAALLLRAIAAGESDPDSIPWLAGFLLVLVVAAPLAGSIVAAPLFHLVDGQPLAPAFHDWFAAHALGLLIFVPAFGTALRAAREPGLLFARREALYATLGFAGAMIAAASAAFGQSDRPLTFLPILILAASVIWAEPAAIALLYVLLAVIAGGLTASGHNPLGLTHAGAHTGIAGQMAFLQAYLAAALLCTIPLAGAVQRRARLVERLRESEARYRLLADNSTDIIMSTATDGTIRFVSPSVLQICQHQPAALIGQSAYTLIAEQHHEAVAEATARAIEQPGETVHIGFLGLPRYAPPRWFESHLRAVAGEDGAAECLVSVIRDMSERKEFETALALAALTDPLTGLPNRRLFMEALAECIAGGRPGCVALIDLDHFKRVNDSFGHAAGDEVLKTFARVAREGLRSSDTLARIGGEEFALLLPGASLEMGEMICGRLGARLSSAITEYGDSRIAITTSIGLARISRDAQQTFAQADRALYEAKAGGRDRLAVAA